MSQSRSEFIFEHLESAKMSIPNFRQYFVQFPKRINGNLCTVRKSVFGTLLCITYLQLVFRIFWDMDVYAITISLWNLRKWTYSYFGTLYRVGPNDIYVPSLHRWITCFWHCYVLYRAPAKPHQFRHDRRLRDFDLNEITVDFVVKSKWL